MDGRSPAAILSGALLAWLLVAGLGCDSLGKDSGSSGLIPGVPVHVTGPWTGNWVTRNANGELIEVGTVQFDLVQDAQQDVTGPTDQTGATWVTTAKPGNPFLACFGVPLNTPLVGVVRAGVEFLTLKGRMLVPVTGTRVVEADLNVLGDRMNGTFTLIDQSLPELCRQLFGTLDAVAP